MTPELLAILVTSTIQTAGIACLGIMTYRGGREGRRLARLLAKLIVQETGKVTDRLGPPPSA